MAMASLLLVACSALAVNLMGFKANMTRVNTLTLSAQVTNSDYSPSHLG